MDKRRREAKSKKSQIFFSPKSENSVQEACSFSLISGIENGYGQEVDISVFRPNCFVSQYQNISQKNPSVFQNILVTSKKFMPNSGLSRSCIENLLSHSTETF